jgi:lysine 2,3-aminomutase
MEDDNFGAEEAEPPGRLPALKPAPRAAQAALTIKVQPRQRPTIVVLKGASPAAKLPSGPRTLSFRKRFYPDVSSSQWNDWQWQLHHRIASLEALERILTLSGAERAAIASANGFPWAVTPYFASLLDPEDPWQALRRTVIPLPAESLAAAAETIDPLGEERDSPVPGLVHRYPDRVLFMVTGYCSTYCRYCTRSRMVCDAARNRFSFDHWEKAIDYIQAHTQVRDVLLSGGDPLTSGDEKLQWLLTRLRRIAHVEIIRIGTKTPAVLPQRITAALVRMLRRFHPLYLSIHFTHPDELTPETRTACNRLADAGIPLGSQTVLLAGINDNAQTMKALMQGLLRIRVRPYYLYQCDPIVGSAHFRTPVQRGLDIIAALRGHTTGYAVPHYIIDAPGGGGKIPLLPEYVQGRDKEGLVLKNYAGGLYRYPDPMPAW